MSQLRSGLPAGREPERSPPPHRPPHPRQPPPKNVQ